MDVGLCKEFRLVVCNQKAPTVCQMLLLFVVLGQTQQKKLALKMENQKSEQKGKFKRPIICVFGYQRDIWINTKQWRVPKMETIGLTHNTIFFFNIYLFIQAAPCFCCGMWDLVP